MRGNNFETSAFTCTSVFDAFDQPCLYPSFTVNDTGSMKLECSRGCQMGVPAISGLSGCADILRQGTRIMASSFKGSKTELSVNTIVLWALIAGSPWQTNSLLGKR